MVRKNSFRPGIWTDLPIVPLLAMALGWDGDISPFLRVAQVCTSIAQEVFYPGNGVSLPVVVTEVHPSAEASATVALQCTVRPDGTASDIDVAFSPNARLTQAATDALSKWQFTPGSKEGKPVAVRIFVGVSFVVSRQEGTRCAAPGRRALCLRIAIIILGNHPGFPTGTVKAHRHDPGGSPGRGPWLCFS